MLAGKIIQSVLHDAGVPQDRLAGDALALHAVEDQFHGPLVASVLIEREPNHLSYQQIGDGRHVLVGRQFSQQFRGDFLDQVVGRPLAQHPPEHLRDLDAKCCRRLCHTQGSTAAAVRARALTSSSHSLAVPTAML